MSSRRNAGVELSDSSGDGVESDDSDILFEFDDGPHPGAPSTASASVRRDFVLVGVLTSFAAAQREMSERDDYVHTYETRYETDRLLVHVFLCRPHGGCAHRYKIRRIAVGDTDPEIEFHLEEHGDHALTALPVRRRGIHPTLTEEVDALLDMGWGAMQLRNLLNHKYRDDPRRLRIVPTCKQLENRKAFLVRSSPNGWEVKNHATFTAWASTKICSTRDEFDSISDPADRMMDDMIVLDAFSFGSVDTESGTSFDVLVTSRRVFRNIVTCARDQGQQLVCSTDGTYMLHFGGWTVVDCGSSAVFWDRNSYVHRFVPWLSMFVRSESTDAYRRMFGVTKARAALLFDLEVEVAFGSLDHCDAIASAFLTVWPSITLLTCWTHLARQSRKKKVC
ncbi:hypothetical protein PR003_g9930 [Phytophthora rubi]|uniref:MULE transposase domain-containing protein n=1 Tax=Phytophthora rubi TaxID=129364 RepID=A0A6A4FQU4_9STRA|nr:hypothetical protein PR001_g9485 [Phytophthora rubi]KAE9341545.1 hypothetical protein PR003_g9930 [Phytophthora rubi]